MVVYLVLLTIIRSFLIAAIGEELTFEDVNISSYFADDGGFSDGRTSHVNMYSASIAGERLGLIPSLSRSDRSHSQQSAVQAPLSPGGSVGSSSVASRGSDNGRSVKSGFSARSLKQPLDRLASC